VAKTHENALVDIKPSMRYRTSKGRNRNGATKSTESLAGRSSHRLLSGLSRTSRGATLNELIAGAKKKSEIAFIAYGTTFGGPKAFPELQTVFNKKFGLNARINLTAGPSMPAMAAMGSKDCVPWDQSAMW
jgi:hypothetical protein